jgi:hypothetical protein
LGGETIDQSAQEMLDLEARQRGEKPYGQNDRNCHQGNDARRLLDAAVLLGVLPAD